MKSNHLILTLLLVLPVVTFGQRESRDRIEAMKVAFFTERLDLSPEEAQKFWPVYNRFRDEMRQFHEARRKQMEKFREDGSGIDGMSDEELKKEMAKELTREEEMLKLRKKYHEEFLKVLPPAKVARLYGAEMQFERKLLDRLRKRDVDGPDGRRRIHRPEDKPAPPHNE